MGALTARRLKLLNLTIGTVSVECQLSSWNLDPGVQDGDRLYSYCPDGVTIGETDAEPTLQLKTYSKWVAGGFEDFCWTNRGVVADFQLDHHPDIALEHVRWNGQVLVQPTPVGGDRGDQEMTEITFMCVGDPDYSRP